MELDRLLAQILATATADALVVIDREQRVVLFSPGAERIFGFQSDEVVGGPLEILLPEWARGIHRDHVRSFEKSAVASRLMGERNRIHGRRPDGSEFPADASISRVEVDGERFYAAVVRDATDRVRAEEELRRSEAELAEAQRLAHIGSWEWEIAEDRVRWSDEMYRVFGRAPGSVLAYSDILDRVHADDRIAANAEVEEAIRSGSVYESDARILRDDGAVRVVHVRGRVVRDAQGRPVRMHGTAQDVTEQRHGEERAREILRQQTERLAAQAAATRFRFLAEASQILGSSLAIEETLRSVARLTVPDIGDWCSLDLVGPKGELRRVEVAHADPEKLRVADEIHRRFPPDTRTDNPAAAALQRGEAVLIEDFSEAVVQLATQDEEHRALLRKLAVRSAMCVPLIARERLVGLITLATAESKRRFGSDDVSLMKSLADRAALAIDNARLFEQAQAAAAAREEAVATVSHDLRSRLGVIGVNIMLLEEQHLPEPERERALDRMKRAVAGMKRMVDDILDVTRLEAGGVSLRTRGCEIETLIREACELETPAATARAVKMEVHAAPGLCIHADPDRVIQVIANLLNNAVRHSPEAGCVRVAVRVAGQVAIVSVEDEGPGVPPELRDSIFQRFWQNESRKRGAAGLGLAIARAIVELHDGRIWVEDAPRGGACFRFTLPLSPRE